MECQICFEPYDVNNFIPKMLINCGHSFCKICLDRIINKRTVVTCPVCREQTRISKKDKENSILPTNFSIVELIDKNKKLEDSKKILEKYKYFDENLYSCINTSITRCFEPKTLTLKKIVNDDFIYVEEFEGNQNTSLFSSYKKRNRRYNFNRHSAFSYLFNEYSFSIEMYRKASKCKHSFSCIEVIIKKILYGFTMWYFSKYLFKYIHSKPKLLDYLPSFVKENSFADYSRLAIGGLCIVPQLLSCLTGFYIDQILELKN